MERVEKERYPSFIHIPRGGKLPKFTNEIVSGLQLERSKTIMGYGEQIKKKEKDKSNSPDSLLKINNDSSAFTPIDGSPNDNNDNCNLN